MALGISFAPVRLAEHHGRIATSRPCREAGLLAEWGLLEGAIMGDVVNLNQHRKARARAEAGKRAEENRQRFGRTKEEREREAKERADAERRHELLRLDEARSGGTPPEPPKKP